MDNDINGLTSGLFGRTGNRTQATQVVSEWSGINRDTPKVGQSVQ